jgi:hypothetical protein
VLAPRALRLRSRLSNCNEILPGIDQRTTLARRYRDLVNMIAADQGGIEHLAESRWRMIRRFAGASALAEVVEARIANGEQIDIQEYSTLTWVAVDAPEEQPKAAVSTCRAASGAAQCRRRQRCTFLLAPLRPSLRQQISCLRPTQS